MFLTFIISHCAAASEYIDTRNHFQHLSSAHNETESLGVTGTTEIKSGKNVYSSLTPGGDHELSTIAKVDTQTQGTKRHGGTNALH